MPRLLIKILAKKLASKLGFDLAEGRGTGVTLTTAQIESELTKLIPFENYTQTIGLSEFLEKPINELLLQVLQQDKKSKSKGN